MLQVSISGFPGVNLAEFIKWILGLIGSDEEKRLFYQNITINYRPHVSTCSIPDTTGHATGNRSYQPDIRGKGSAVL